MEDIKRERLNWMHYVEIRRRCVDKYMPGGDLRVHLERKYASRELTLKIEKLEKEEESKRNLLWRLYVKATEE